MSSRFVSAGGAEVKAPAGLSKTTDDAWEKARKQVEDARKPSSTAPAPGTQEGGVSLYDHLQAQKQAKQEAFEEASKVKNQFRPLDQGEVEFLESIKQKRIKEANEAKKETKDGVKAFNEKKAKAEKDAKEKAKAPLYKPFKYDPKAKSDARLAWEIKGKRKRAAEAKEKGEEPPVDKDPPLDAVTQKRIDHIIRQQERDRQKRSPKEQKLWDKADLEKRMIPKATIKYLAYGLVDYDSD